VGGHLVTFPPLVVDDDLTRLNLEYLGEHLLIGKGAPTLRPGADRGLYLRLDGGAGTTLYVWEGAAWVGK
jgi:hypothetical protein